MQPLIIKEARLAITDDCPYSCRYCAVYASKALKLKRITQDEYDAMFVAGNEGASIVPGRCKSKYLTPDDYIFLARVLKEQYGTDDITLTGGDPFTRSDITEIIDGARNLDFSVTAITKGMPLFNKNIKTVLGNLSRIIFSIDTIDSEMHADINLPLTNKDAAIKALKKTLSVVKKTVAAGYNVEINTVFLPSEKYHKNTAEIILFAAKNKVKKVKLIELESKETAGHPFIEMAFGIEPDYSRLAIPIMTVRKTDVYAFRTHCQTSLITGNTDNCNLKIKGELNINPIGEVVLCQKKQNLISIRHEIVNRDVDGLINKINQIADKTACQSCIKLVP